MPPRRRPRPILCALSLLLASLPQNTIPSPSSPSTCLYPSSPPLLLPRLLGLRGGGRRDGGIPGWKVAPSETVGPEDRKIRMRKDRWRKRFNDGKGKYDSSDLSSEDGDEDDDDRPDVYRKPVQPPPQDHWDKENELPAWMDPIYDDIDSHEYAEAEYQVSESDSEYSRPHSSLSTSSDGFAMNETTQELTLTNHRRKGQVHDDDFKKDMTFSEVEEALRIHGMPECLDELEHIPCYVPNYDHDPLGLELTEDDRDAPAIESTRERNGGESGREREDGGSGRDRKGGESGREREDGESGRDRKGGDSGMVRVDIGGKTLPPQGEVGQLGVPTEGGGGEVVAERRGIVRATADDLFVRTLDEEGGETGLEDEDEEGMLVRQEDALTAHTGDGEESQALGVLQEGKHPLEHRFDLEGAREEMRKWSLRSVLEEHDWKQYQTEQDREDIRAIRRRWGVVPRPGMDVYGFNKFDTAHPLPPPAASRSRLLSDFLVPQKHATVPRALQACLDGGRIFVARGNHTWLGPLEGSFDCNTTRAPLPEGDVEQMIGFAVIPPGPGLYRATTDDDETHLLDHMRDEVEGQGGGEEEERGGGGGEAFCVHLAGEEGARLCGRILMRNGSCGSIRGLEVHTEANETDLYDNAGLMMWPTLEVHGAPWLFEGVGIRACGSIALSCARRSLVKCKGCAIGGISHDRRVRAVAGRALIGVHGRDFARMVVDECTIEMAGLLHMPAARFTGCCKATLEGCLLQRATHGIGLLDRCEVRVRNTTLKEFNQGALWAPQPMGAVRCGAPEDTLSTPFRQSDVLRPLAAKGQQVFWDSDAGEYVTKRPAETIRFDPIFGNLTDGWTRGLPGWTEGVPPDVVADIDATIDVDGVCASDIPDESFRWGTDEDYGCVASLMVARGSLEGDVLMPGFNAGGGHEASLQVLNCTVLGDLWSSYGRPRKCAIKNLVKLRDPWVEKYWGNRTERGTGREWLEQIGCRWNAKRSMYQKPIRMLNGTVVYADWNETRFRSEAVPGGWPGCRVDYPMYDRRTGLFIDPFLSSSRVFKTEWFPLLNEEFPVLGPQGLRRLDRLRQKGARRKREEEERQRLCGEVEEGNPLGLVDPVEQKEADIRRLILRFIERKKIQDDIWRLDDKDYHLLEDQDVPPIPEGVELHDCD